MENWRALVRYNYRALMGNSYWLIAVPIAASQILALWNIVVGSVFLEASVIRAAELLTPILGAFMAAHTLGVEYRSRIGAVVVAKPVPVQRVLLIRLGLIFVFLLALLAIMMITFRLAVGDFPMVPTFLAGLPSLLFLSMLALTVATVTRNAMVGFLVAAVYWGLDLLGGASMNPVLTLQSYSELLMQRPLTEGWLWNKAALTVGGLALFELHRRAWLRPEAPFTRRRRIRQAFALVAVLALYVYSGAAYKVAYARARPFGLPLAMRQWLRAQFAVYGPVPVAWVFGPAFAHYIGHTAPWRGGAYDVGSLTGDSPVMVEMLKAVPERYPDSVCSNAARLDYARVVSVRGSLPEAFQTLRELSALPSDNAYGLAALREWLAMARRHNQPEEALAAAEATLAQYPRSAEAYDAGLYAGEELRKRGRAEEAVKAADTAASVAGPIQRPAALALSAEALLAAGRRDAARARAAEAMNATSTQMPGVTYAERMRAERGYQDIRTRMDRLLRETQ